MKPKQSDLRALLSRWRDFACFEQRLLAFLAAEVTATGDAFESSTDGSVGILGQLARHAQTHKDHDLEVDIARLVERLQDADRRKQELMQVATTISELLRQQAELLMASRVNSHADTPPPDWEEWCRRQETAVTLTSWRNRLSAALSGEKATVSTEADEDTVLF